MQTAHLINHSFELRIAFALVSIVVLFATVKLASFIEASVTRFLSARQSKPRQAPSLSTAYAGTR